MTDTPATSRVSAGPESGTLLGYVLDPRPDEVLTPAEAARVLDIHPSQVLDVAGVTPVYSP